MIKKWISGLLCLVILCSFSGCKGSKNPLLILDNEGREVASVSSERAVRKHEDRAYVEMVTKEAAEILSKLLGLSESQAQKKIYDGGYVVYTAYDPKMNKALATACAAKEKEIEVAAVITDLSAHVCAAYSSKCSNKETSYATAKEPPCSAFKPLSVYAPAIENGTITWFSRYQDTPYKQIRAANGALTSWPSNPNRNYSNTDVYIHEAIRQSLNTVAVKCLKDYGVKNSIQFLEETFQVALDTEKRLMESGGEEEIIGNIALGSLRGGVSALDMAGYYQIFANGGKYQAPKAILKLCDGNGEVLYESVYAPKQAISTKTADIMNRMLQEVVSPSGTGKNAMLEKVEAAGKTGTDEDNKNNWFIGVTPEYSCAFWHGGAPKNIASQIFADAMNAIYDEREEYREKFIYTSGIQKVAYCTESGEQFHLGCPLIDIGYDVLENFPKLCDHH